MGWLTEKNIIWEIKKGSILLGCLIVPVFLPFGIWYMGKQAKMAKMMEGLRGVGILFGLNLLNWIVIGIMIKASIGFNDNFHMVLSMLLFGSFLFYSVILLGANTREFLQREHLKEFMELDWEEYDYVTLIRSKEIREVTTLLDFVEELKRWDIAILDEKVSSQIVDLVALLTKINSLKEGQTALFIERHVFSLTSLLRQFHQVELSKLEGNSIHRVKEKLRQTLDIALSAIRQEVLDEMKQQNRVAEVEADVYLASLRNDGLL
ncbi:hypothetical protein M2306_000008 [Myroides gitamensis]|uniref:hypothetical protein n=1 Tax=Myroides odoratus TaxID=256 RepID=UPI00216755E0|nr:hypothetical protein [Myroides odoratus]MCS4239676.1 hypothetical protein [Myroides odoratus]MDH6599314.1 hypothetical protein [Myroides gitamensis]